MPGLIHELHSPRPLLGHLVWLTVVAPSIMPLPHKALKKEDLCKLAKVAGAKGASPEVTSRRSFWDPMTSQCSVGVKF